MWIILNFYIFVWFLLSILVLLEIVLMVDRGVHQTVSFHILWHHQARKCPVLLELWEVECYLCLLPTHTSSPSPLADIDWNILKPSCSLFVFISFSLFFCFNYLILQNETASTVWKCWVLLNFLGTWSSVDYWRLITNWF